LPKNFNPKNKYPIIYATDGSDIDDEDFYFKESLKAFDSLIDNDIIKPFIFIASYYNNEYTNIIIDTLEHGEKFYYPFRNIEYERLKQPKDSLLTNRFDNHMLYFKDELTSKVEREFNQRLNKNDRYFYGSSAGAGFGISLLNKYPNKIGTYLCFSTYGGNIQSKKWKNNIEYPILYFQYGTEEPLLKDDADYLKSKYQELNINYHVKQFNGGHNYKIWDKEFIKTITHLFKTN
jgi:enterochelin esterase-like enzyme